MKNLSLFASVAVLMLILGFTNDPTPSVRGLSLESIQLTAADLPEGYTLVDQSQCKSIQAVTLYKNPEIYEIIIGKVKAKKFQSFKSKKDTGTILYFEFAEPYKETSFLEGLLWGGDKPTKAHPEEYLVKDNLLIIWSTDQKSELKKLSKSKIENMQK